MLCRLIFSLLSNQIIVAVDRSSSPSFPVNSGVPQVSVLSPALFPLFINDLSTSSSIYTSANKLALHSSTFFKSQHSSRASSVSRLTSIAFLTSDPDNKFRLVRRTLVKCFQDPFSFCFCNIQGTYLLMCHVKSKGKLRYYFSQGSPWVSPCRTKEDLSKI